MTKTILKADSRPKFYLLEKEVLEFWKEKDILKKSIAKNPDNKQKNFYDGPITANGMPHHGHMLTFAIKDLFPRYWTMQGYQVQRSLGWDCQGIPVEFEVEKKLEFKEKKDIENYGIAKFNQLCRESVLEYKTAMIDLEEKMGRLTDNKEEYSTMDANYIESIWWSLAEIYKKNLLYEGFKVVPYSTRAGTSLSNAEVALGGYKKVIDKAVTIKFKLLNENDQNNENNTFVLAWTTTPWTLPTNFGLAVGSNIEYVKVLKTDDKENFYIVAKQLAENIFGKEKKDYIIIDSFKGNDLIGKKYEPLFDYFTDRLNCFQIYEGFHVTEESGTGIVHLAPYGAEDCEIFKSVGIEAIDVLNSQGDYTSDIPDMEGVFYKAANKRIIEKLEQNNKLFKVEDYEHDVPMCWRTNTPLIYKPITSWYIAMSKLRSELLANNSEVNWIPSHVKEGRFGHWLAEIKDWGISRLRYWGTPIPIWKSETGKVKVIGSYKELEELSGVSLNDPHRPFIDDVKFEIDGENYTRIPDVIDVWYDSGAMPFARFHYPFENKELFEKKFPAEFIAEGVDQTRGWFYSLMAISTAVFGKTPYKNVVINGFTLDDKGLKVSKSKKNYDAPDILFENFGADTIRMNYFTTPIVSGEDTTISSNTLKTTTQEFTLPLWNIFVYLTTYIELFDWKIDSKNTDNIKNSEQILDKWIKTRLNQTNKLVINNLDKFNIQKATAEINNFLDDLSKWYIRRSRDRFAKGEPEAINTLYYCLTEIIKILSPFTPFITENIYQNIAVGILENAKESVHLESYPSNLEFDQKLIDEMQVIRELCSIGLNIRTEIGINLRQPLQTLYTNFSNPELLKILRAELNTKIVAVQKVKPELPSREFGEFYISLDPKLTAELKNEGIIIALCRQIQNTRKTNGLKQGALTQAKLYLTNKEIIDLISLNLLHICKTVALENLEIVSQSPEIIENFDIKNIFKLESSKLGIVFND